MRLALVFARRPRAATLLALAIPALLAASPAKAERQIERLPATDIPGFDYDIRRDVPLQTCEAACLGDTRCEAFTYNETASWCFLKEGIGETAPYAGATSGRIVDIATPPPSTLAMPDISYLPEAIAVEGDALLAEVEAAARMGERVGNFSPDSARGLLADPADWIRLADEIIREVGRSDDWVIQRSRTRDAAAAAYVALERAPTIPLQASALAWISFALEQQGIYRPAIRALEESLALAPSQQNADRLARLRADHGFRVVDYSIDSDTATPRMCVQYSEPLAGTADALSPFVAVEGIPSPVVTTSRNELCVEGLTHGSRYRVTVRAGVEAETGEMIGSPAEYVFYVRDRAPTARFAAGAYVLPRAAGGGVPVTTVNTERLSLDLFRIGDRSLVSSIRSGDFQRQLSTWELDTIRRDSGERVWSGTMDVEQRTNEEVTTAFPVREAAGELKPGVYVLVAVPEESTDAWGPRATQWFVVSDLGLAAYSSDDAVDVFVRALGTAEPVAGAAVTIVARNDDVLGRGVTDARGHVRVVTPGARAADGGRTPAMVTATVGGAADEPDGGADDYAFLSLAAGAFDLADRGVAGRAAPGPVDVFLVADRGVYRGGEVVNLTMLARDDGADALENLPVTVIVTRPDGVEDRREVVRSATAGGSHVAIDLLPAAMTGTWRVAAHVDPDAPAVGETTFLVEDFVPQRIEVELSSDIERAAPGDTFEVTVDARFLYGAPGADLRLEGNVLVRPSEDGLPAFPGYVFGLADDPMTPVRQTLLGLPRTGPDGTAVATVRLPDLPQTTRPLEAVVTIGVAEPGGRVVEGDVAVPVEAEGPMIGVRPRFPGGEVPEGSVAAFDVIAVGPDGERRAMAGLAWRLLEVNRTFQYYMEDGRWRWEAVESTTVIANGTLDVAADAPATVEASVDWGRYRLEVTDPGSPVTATTVGFSAGWVNLAATAETPDLLEVHLDAERYLAGDTANLRIVPRHAGKALVTVMSEAVEHIELVDVPADGAVVPLEVSADWGPGAYVTVALYRPGEGASAADARLPARAIGLSWLGLDETERTIALGLDLPETTRPRTTLDVPVTLGDLDPGEEAFLTVAAVDVGILNLTGYEPPDATGWYFGQRRLGVEMRDLWGQLIDNRGARLGQIRTGGDGGALSAAVLPPTEAPVSLFSGLVQADAEGRATVSFDLPAFNGTLRVMAIAWSDDKVGDAAADVIVRDPVVLAAAMPRFLAPDDTSRIRIDLDNVEGAAGEYTVTLAADGPVAIDGPSRTLTLAAGAREALAFPVAATGVGTATIESRVAGPDGTVLTDSFVLPVRPAAAPVARPVAQAIAPGGSLDLTDTQFSGFIEDTVSLAVSVQAGVPIDVPGLLVMLDRFPYGCAEQTTSRALPLLYVNDVAREIGLAADREIPARIDKAIQEVLSFQDSTGGFGLWGPGRYDLWLTAYVMDFLTRAREKGFDVPDRAYTAGLDRLQSELSYVSEISSARGVDVAYASDVLARNGRAAIGDLRYFAEESASAFEPAMAKAQLGAALAAVGDDVRADRMFQAAATAIEPGVPDQSVSGVYGTPVRDAAAALALAAENGAPADTLSALSTGLRTALDRGHRDRPTTQEAAWLLLAAHALQGESGGVRLSVDDVDHDGAWYANLTPAMLADGPITIANRGEAAVGATLTVRGTPLRPLPPAQSGFTVRKRVFNLDGTELPAGAANSAGPAAITGDAFSIPQNERLVIVLEATVVDPRPGRLLLVDMLPAGFEIENPALVSSADASAFAWLKTTPRPDHAEFRDDRFAAAYDGDDAGRTIRAAYMVRAVSPGTYTNPAATIEDMYDPGRFARTGAGTLTVTTTQ